MSAPLRVFTAGVLLGWLALLLLTPRVDAIVVCSMLAVFTLIPCAILCGCLANREHQLSLFGLRVAACTLPLFLCFAWLVASRSRHVSPDPAFYKHWMGAILCGFACILVAVVILARAHRNRIARSRAAFWVTCWSLVVLNTLIGVGMLASRLLPD